MTQDTTITPLERLIDAALPHVAFDGWAQATWDAAVTDSGVDPATARALCPRGAVDLALSFHRRGDRLMIERLKAEDLSALRFRDRIQRAVRYRIEIVAPHKEAVRRGTTLFSLPQYMPDGAGAIWGTVDAIWTALGDPSDDINWYTKRGTLGAVYGATVLFWLGDDSPGWMNTWDFLERRIDNVMQIEKAKGTMRKNPLLRPLIAGPAWLTRGVKAPGRGRFRGMPGSINRQGW